MARWKRGQAAQGVKQAVHYAFGGVCDATLTAKTAGGALAAAGYADAVMTRYIVENGAIRDDLLTRSQLKDWVDGVDPLTGERRGRDLESPVADLILDATINAPKSFSIAAMLDPALADAYEDLQDRLRDRIIKLWQTELNARRGKQGCFREDLARIEVVELRHERSRSLDPHKHRHLWLNVKVQGLDGKWSNVDTRVALRFQNVVNAEGDLACRTDPTWIAALAAKSFTLNSDGEIAQLQHLVRPLSKRSAQIESNKTVHLRQWKEQHPGEEPSATVLTQIDQWAWAAGRPNKPGHLDEDDWASVVMTELLRADPELADHRGENAIRSVAFDDLDIDLLAAKAIVDADSRSTGTGGRFSDMDIRAGAIRAVAGSRVRANRSELEFIVDKVTSLAARSRTVTLIDSPGVPHHVKHRMATSTAALKTTVAHRIDPLSYDGDDRARNEVIAIALRVEPEQELTGEQLAGASSLAGTAGIVCISGAAGAGKTTMLKVASAALRQSGRNMIIVAPTKKASSVAGREANSSSSSLHQLLYDFGWRWKTNDAGSVGWSKLNPGDVDRDSGVTYRGPTQAIRPGDRIVVDEAGMLELEAANALLDVIARTGAGVAMVGDQRQALPVGHSGAMALFWNRAPRRIELTTIHRFRDPGWAQLSLRLREPDSSEDMHAIAQELIETGHVARVNSDADAGAAMVDAWFQASRRGETIALVTATHAESQSISEAIQARRLAAGQVSRRRQFIGQAGQVIGIGDIVQTRRNDSTTGVDNRRSWTVQKITDEHVVLGAAGNSSDVRRVSMSYAAEYVHLGYASTVYGVQGETTDRSLVGPGVDASGLYVGLTRGRERNDIVLVAPTPSAAERELVEMMQRQPIEETLEKSRAAARQELRRAATLDPSVTGPAPSSPEPQGRAASIQR
ncbi:AAA family ATPase [Leifsonia sp. 21MFCrub1.1]|uniref:AAA family ATPase n=1 Tax=Leifsonia sp. 21MFCrub1.1 TaxID=1798223 RepID=UPI00089285F4|nr:AAA family ATPase [Leifsonia sp. 21MFCrub1.1]SEB08865.1 TrwC relaxase [Leifsonia sp. 21MFCrub1.1]